MIFINHSEAKEGKIVIVEIQGALDSNTSTDFEEYINQLLDKDKKFIILNAGRLEFVSSTGIGVVLYIQKKILARNGHFVICSISDEILSLYKFLGFDKLFKIAEDSDEARQIMEKQIDLRSGADWIPLESPPSPDSIEIESLEASSNDAKYVHEDNESVKEFENPIILECSECKSMIRVKKSGKYMCPDCKADFTVDPDQTIVF